ARDRHALLRRQAGAAPGDPGPLPARGSSQRADAAPVGGAAGRAPRLRGPHARDRRDPRHHRHRGQGRAQLLLHLPRAPRGQVPPPGVLDALVRPRRLRRDVRLPGRGARHRQRRARPRGPLQHPEGRVPRLLRHRPGPAGERHLLRARHEEPLPSPHRGAEARRGARAVARARRRQRGPREGRAVLAGRRGSPGGGGRNRRPGARGGRRGLMAEGAPVPPAGQGPMTSRRDPRYEVTLYRYVGVPGSHTLDFYRSHGGYEAARKALTSMTPEQVVDEVKASGLRGRGGAGFPTGVKWSFMPPPDGHPRYVLCNADESEPGSFKDRYILEDDPHQLIEGMIIAAYAMHATYGFIYVRGEYYLAYERLWEAVREARAAGLLGEDVFGTGMSFDITVHRGAGAYICGEETALMNSLEGLRANPRLKPPFPAAAGLYGRPTTINNVESLASAVHIIAREIG